MATKSIKPAAKSARAETNGFSLISDETLRALYADLRQCRRVTKNGAYDALPAGVWMDLVDGDVVVSTTADATVRLKRKDKPAAGVGEGLDLVLGAALLAKTRRSGKVGVVFGDAEAEGWKDALELARAHALPVIFVSRAEGADEKEAARAVRKPRKGSSKAKTAEAEGYLPRIHVDADDVVAVYRVAHESIDRARRGRGAAWIEGIPFKPEGRRRRADAVEGMEEYLRGKGLL